MLGGIETNSITEAFGEFRWEHITLHCLVGKTSQKIKKIWNFTSNLFFIHLQTDLGRHSLLIPSVSQHRLVTSTWQQKLHQLCSSLKAPTHCRFRMGQIWLYSNSIMCLHHTLSYQWLNYVVYAITCVYCNSEFINFNNGIIDNRHLTWDL